MMAFMDSAEEGRLRSGVRGNMASWILQGWRVSAYESCGKKTFPMLV